ncbi:hypothetical protein DYB32_001628 [Aphanomyces invadans]|uniref:L-ornithine N(5)-monooxygenase [NAD(P)H] n=1 Tax=Aphanomyces invadans TaxID=157072 RepID=A0A3R6Z8Z4_9STRA|nr:hypothetical protein DYB32_001628 [Aphanomyces invadans]
MVHSHDSRSSGASLSADIAPILVIGAGPHALALVLTLLEEHASSEFTERDTIHMGFWTKKLGRKNTSSGKHEKPHAVAASASLRRQIRVLDPSGAWCSTWNHNFATFGISHLRSPVNVHLDPLRPEGLRDFATSTNQLASQVTEPPPSIRFNRRNRAFTTNTSLFSENDRPFFGCPSRELFADFHAYLIKLYGIHSMVEKAKAVSIEPLHFACHDSPHFKVTCADGNVIVAKHVVVAIGTQNIPRIPPWATSLRQHLDIQGGMVVHSSDAVLHTLAFSNCLRKKHILVVGGGLTSVHLVRQVLTTWGADHATLVTRKPTLIVQPYDVPVEWMSPLMRAKMLADFFDEPTPQMKLTRIREARRGGSVTRSALAQLNAVTTPESYTHRGNTQVTNVERFVADGGGHRLRVTLTNGEASAERVVDHIILATGSDIDVSKEVLFDGVRDLGGIPVGGLPPIDNELRWAPNTNLFVMGGYAALQLGPTAGNLMGARAGANKLAELLLEGVATKASQTRHHHLRALCGKENLYDFLS